MVRMPLNLYLTCLIGSDCVVLEEEYAKICVPSEAEEAPGSFFIYVLLLVTVEVPCSTFTNLV